MLASSRPCAKSKAAEILVVKLVTGGSSLVGASVIRRQCCCVGGPRSSQLERNVFVVAKRVASSSRVEAL